MASRFLDRLKRSLFKDGPAAAAAAGEQEQEVGGGGEQEVDVSQDRWEAELEEEEECVSERLGGTLCFDTGAGGSEDGAEGDGEGRDSDSMEEGPCSTDASPGGVSPVGPAPSSLLTRLRGLGGGGPLHGVKRQPDGLLFEVTDASAVQEGASKYVLYTIHVIQAGSSDKTPAVITRRYSDFQRLHATLRRNHADQMERVSFPRKKLRRNFTAETIARRSRAFEQYLSHLCALPVLRAAPSIRRFFYLSDLEAGQLLIRAGRFQEALGPLLNAKRLQLKLGWACNAVSQPQAPPPACNPVSQPQAPPPACNPVSQPQAPPPACNPVSQPQAPPPASPHWFFTTVGLLYCFQEAEHLEEARDHCDLALCVLINKPLLQQDCPHPLLLPLLQAMIRLSWQTGRDKQQWEELLQGQGAEPDSLLTIREFLVKQNLQESDDDN